MIIATSQRGRMKRVDAESILSQAILDPTRRNWCRYADASFRLAL